MLKPIKPAVFSAMLDKLAERLAGTRLSSERRSKWLVASLEKVGPFAETVWLHKGDKVERELGAIYRDLSELTDDGDYERKSMLADFAVLAVGELEAKQHEALPLPTPIPADWPAADGELLEAANSFFERLMNMLRETRRWSSHHHLYRAVEHMKSHFAKLFIRLNGVSPTEYRKRLGFK